MRACIVEELDKRVGPAPQGPMEEALAQRVNANKRIRELRKEAKRRRLHSPSPQLARAANEAEPCQEPLPPPLEEAHPLADRERAALDYCSVERIVSDATEGNLWVKAADHGKHIADFLGHLVAASFASPERCGQTPSGYNFLPPVAFPHPNAEQRARTGIAKEIVDAMGPDIRHQIFALVLWRYHNTTEAWARFRNHLVRFVVDEDESALRHGIQAAYGDNSCKSYLFSTGDGIRSTGGQKSWRSAVLTHLAAWWRAAQRAGAILLHPNTTPESWHCAFTDEIVPLLPCFGLDYWPKFVYGDIGLHVAPRICDLESFTIVGVGCRALLKSWGIPLPSGGQAAQRAGLQAIRELQRCVAAVFASRAHAGIEAARLGASLRAPSAYDIQVQSCECKRGHRLPPRVAKARLPLAAAKE